MSVQLFGVCVVCGGGCVGEGGWVCGMWDKQRGKRAECRCSIPAAAARTPSLLLLLLLLPVLRLVSGNWRPLGGKDGTAHQLTVGRWGRLVLADHPLLVTR